MNNKFFPRERSTEILGELSAWASVSDIMVSARILEGRTILGDEPNSMLVMPLEHAEPPFEELFAILLGHFIEGFAVHPQKVAVCRALDPQITEATATALQSLRFRPDVQVGKAPNAHDKRVLLIQDQPAVIELVRAPLNCLMGLYLDKYEYTMHLRDMISRAGDTTGGRPTIFHRPYSDSLLPCFIEAACFYALGLEVGTRFASPGQANIDAAYRAVNVQTLPPADPAVLRAALLAGQRMLDALR